MKLLEELLVSDRIHELHRQAHAERLASAARLARPSGTAAWRRGGGAAARWLSGAAANVAVTLDPTLCQPSYGRE